MASCSARPKDYTVATSVLDSSGCAAFRSVSAPYREITRNHHLSPTGPLPGTRQSWFRNPWWGHRRLGASVVALIRRGVFTRFHSFVATSPFRNPEPALNSSSAALTQGLKRRCPGSLQVPPARDQEVVRFSRVRVGTSTAAHAVGHSRGCRGGEGSPPSALSDAGLTTVMKFGCRSKQSLKRLVRRPTLQDGLMCLHSLSMLHNNVLQQSDCDLLITQRILRARAFSASMKYLTRHLQVRAMATPNLHSFCCTYVRHKESN